MMENFFTKEVNHFRRLSQKAQRLLISYLFYSTAYPLISVFINAFIWKNSNNLSSLVAFHMGKFMIIPFIFFISGILLKFFKINKLYFFGSLVISIGAISVVFLKNKTYFDFLLIGLLLGAGSGFYWSSRNYLSVKETDDNNRGYFFGLLFSFATIIAFVVTLSVGWLIVFGLSYQFIMLLVFILITCGGLIVLQESYQSPKISQLFVIKVSDAWKRKRLLHTGLGLVEGASFFIPSLLILKMLGNEGILGTLTAVSSMLSAILLYYYGRKSQKKDHKNYFKLSALIAMVFSLMLAIFFNKISIAIFCLVNGLLMNFLWLTFSPLIMKNIDSDTINQEDTRFSYVFDSEIFLNIGRIISLLVCLFIAYKVDDINSLRYGPIILSILQLLLFVYIDKTRKNIVQQGNLI